jgi:SnoaL-like domain
MLRQAVVTLALALAIMAAACTTQRQEPPRMNTAITAASVIEFLHRFEALAEQEDFALIRELIAEDAYFRYNDGDFIGRAAIQAVFEKTWRGDPTVKRARFYLSDIVVQSIDQHSASATYTYHWEGAQAGREFKIQGRGTRVLLWSEAGFRIKHEHLSRFPRPR